MGAAVLMSWALGIALTGGGVLSFGGVRLSSRSIWRPVLAALLLGGLAAWQATTEERRAARHHARRGVDRAAPWLAGLAASMLAATSAVYNEHVAGGADSSGYLHQSQLWSAGRATLPAPLIGDGPWPLAGWEVSPLGFAPAATPGELGPTYSPGLPWLMSLGAALLGDTGHFLWTPLAAGLIVWLTFVLARRESPPAVALAAALLVAASPPLLFASMQTMSDLLCAALWTATLVALGSAPSPRLWVGGVCAGLALVVRPNLVPVAALVWTVAVAASADGWRGRVRTAVMVGAPLALAAGLIAWINDRLWGSPFSSGYGATGDLFGAGNVPDNLANIWRWTSETGGWWVLAGVPALAGWVVSPGWRRGALAIALVAGVVVSYLPYAVFAEWWYLRFYLAAWPVLATALCVLVWRLGDYWAPQMTPTAIAVAAVLLAGPALRWADDVGVFVLWQSAQRYPAVATWVRDEAPVGAVLWSVQHSGSLSAADAQTVARWDYLAADALDARVDQLAAAGRPAWLVIDDWEMEPWRQRFSGQVRGRLDWAPLAEARLAGARVYVYDLTTPTRAVAPVLIRVLYGGPWPWRRGPAAGAAK